MKTISRIQDRIEAKAHSASSRFTGIIRVIASDRLGRLGLIVLIGIILMAVFAEFIAPHDPTQPNFGNQYAPPSVEHPMGTDNRGHDIFSQIIFASRPALLIGGITSLAVATIGTIIGVLSGYYGGRVDDALMRLVDFTYGLPLLPFLIVAVGLFNPSLATIIAAMGLLLWRGTARVIRSHVLTIKEKPYVKSVRASGASDGRIIIRHIIPNVLPLTFLYGSFAVGWAILTEANLSFLGFGDPEVMTWGKMLLLARQNQALVLDAWWWFFGPGLMIMAFVMSVFAIGRAYEEELNPEISEGGM